MNLDSLDLLELQANFMKSDPNTIAMCDALNPHFKLLQEEVKAVLIYSRINDLKEEVLDELAWSLNVDFWDSSLDVESKRELLKKAILLHRKRGTPKAVEDAASIVFGKSIVTEWFEYGGSPFYFKVIVEASKRGASKSDLDLLDRLIDVYKNKRSWLEVIEIYLTAKQGLYIGASMISGEEITVYPWSPRDINSKGIIKLGTSSNQEIDTTTVYPKEEI